MTDCFIADACSYKTGIPTLCRISTKYGSGHCRPEGKPDLSGVWRVEPPPPREIERVFGDLAPKPSGGRRPSHLCQALPKPPGRLQLEIPAKPNADSERKPNGLTAFRDDPEHRRSVATLASRLCRKCSASSRSSSPQRSGGGMGVWGKGQQSRAPPSAGETSARMAELMGSAIHQLGGYPHPE